MDWAKITVTTSYDAAEAVANCLFEMSATGVEFKENDTQNVQLIAYYPLDDRVGARMQKLRNFLAELSTWEIQTGPATIDLKHVKSEKWKKPGKQPSHRNVSENGFSSYPPGTMPFTTKQTF